MATAGIDEFGKKVGNALIPYTILLTVMDVLLKFGLEFRIKELSLASIIFTIIYWIGWHELRLRQLEDKKRGK